MVDRKVCFFRSADDLARVSKEERDFSRLAAAARLAGLADPASTAARDAPSLSATGRITCWNFSDEPSARPPEMMIFAEVSSGRSDEDSASETKEERPEERAVAAILSSCLCLGNLQLLSNVEL